MLPISGKTALDFLLTKGLTISEVSRLSGVGRKTIYRIQSRSSIGKRPMTPKTEMKLVDAFNAYRQKAVDEERVRKELGL